MRARVSGRAKRAEIVKLHAARNHLMLDRCVVAVMWTMMSQQNWIVTWSHAPGAMRALPLCEIFPANFGGGQFEEGYPNGVDEGAICLAMSSTRVAGGFHGEAESATVDSSRKGSSVWPAVNTTSNNTLPIPSHPKSFFSCTSFSIGPRFGSFAGRRRF